MKRRNILTAMLMLSMSAGFAQVTQTVNTFKIFQPPEWYPLESAATAGTTNPRTRIFLEYGDGYFTTDALSTHHIVDNSTMGLLSLAGIYAPPSPRPPRPRRVAFKQSNEPETNVSHLDAINRFVKINSNVGDVLPGDEMVIALTYKKPLPSFKGLIVLAYNDSELLPFKTITEIQYSEDDGISVPNVRTPKQERVMFNMPREQLIAYSGYVDPRMLDITKYHNNIAFMVDASTTPEEHSVFISIMPRSDIDPEVLKFTTIKAYMISDPGLYPQFIIKHEREMNVNAAGHDPNYIIGKPGCLMDGGAGKRIDYTIHFQNEGIGAVRHLDIAVSLDAGLNINGLQLSNFKVVLGGVPRPFTIDNLQRTASGIIIRYYVPQGAPPLLSGINSVQNAAINEATMGEVKFFIYTNSTATAPITARATVFFYDNDNHLLPGISTASSKITFCCCRKCD